MMYAEGTLPATLAQWPKLAEAPVDRPMWLVDWPLWLWWQVAAGTDQHANAPGMGNGEVAGALPQNRRGHAEPPPMPRGLQPEGLFP